MRQFLFTSLLITLISCAPAIAEKPKPKWPGGVDPATLKINSDSEPDLSDPDFVMLFNGEDLTGWTLKNGKHEFSVKDGVIIGKCNPSQPNGFLCTDKNFGDFIFTTEFRWEVPANSGVMFRSGIRDLKKVKNRVYGYQCEMDQNERRWTGGIYGEAMGGWKNPLSLTKAHRDARAAIKDHSAWNRMTIYAKGNVIKTWINGVPCAHLVNDERSEGFFGLQVHSGKQGEIHWRNIKIKEL